MERIHFFSGDCLPADKHKATPILEEIRIYRDGDEVCAVMGEPMPCEVAAGFGIDVLDSLENLLFQLDDLKNEISWLSEGPVLAAAMSENGPHAYGATPIDALRELASVLPGFVNWEPDLEEE